MVSRMFSFKAKEPVKSGFVGDLSASQGECLDQLKAWVVEDQIVDLELLNFDDHDYLRFCRARNFVIADVKTMLANYVKWRAEN